MGHIPDVELSSVHVQLVEIAFQDSSENHHQRRSNGVLNYTTHIAYLKDILQLPLWKLQYNLKRMRFSYLEIRVIELQWILSIKVAPP